MDITRILETGKTVGTAVVTGVKKVTSDEHFKDVATKIIGSAGAAFAGWKVKKILEKNEQKTAAKPEVTKKGTSKGLTDEDTKIIQMMAQ